MIENVKSARVKRVAALSRKKERQATGRFIVEGPQAVRELLLHRSEAAEMIFASMGNESWHLEIDRLADASGVDIERVTDPVLAAMTETVHPQGVVAIARMEQVSLGAAFAGAKLVAIMHEVRDPGNAGTVLRAADATGADAVVFCGESIDPWHPKVVRSTTGSLFHLPVAVASSLAVVVGEARAAGLEVIAADVRGDQLTPDTEGLSRPIAWLFGNEARGLGEADRALADRALRLPLYGAAESLNLATAASVCLYTTAFRQRA